MFENIIEGFGTVFAVGPILGIITGVIVGIVFGAIPGVSGIMAIAIMLPLTFYVDPVVGITMLLAVYKAGIYGGSISAILINTPGAAAAFLTAQDGYALTRAGKSGKALCMALYASVTGEMLSTLVLIFVAAPISLLSLKAGPIEKVYLLLFAFTVIGSVTGESISRGLLSTCLGMLFATVGMSSITGATRFTFGVPEMMSGFTFTPMLIGVLVMPEVIMAIRRRHDAHASMALTISPNPDDNRISWKEYKSVLGTIIKSSGIGTVLGSLPGLGSTPAAFLAYGEAKRTSKNPEKFGKGSLEGVAAPEAANNGSVGGALVPLLTLGIPGSASTAVLIGALMIHKLNPGPELFDKEPGLVYGIFISLFFANIFMFFVGLLGNKIWIKIIAAPKSLLYPIILALSFIGSYFIQNSVFDVGICIAFGILGWLLKRGDFPTAPVVLGLILGKMIEENLRLSLIKGEWIDFFTRPGSLIIIILAIVSFFMPYIKKKLMKKSS